MGKVVYFERKELLEKAKAREHSDSDKYLLNCWVSRKKAEMIDKQRKDIWPLIENEDFFEKINAHPSVQFVYKILDDLGLWTPGVNHVFDVP